MGWTDVLCCFRFTEPKSEERQGLIAPGRLRGQSIVDQDGYGTMAMSTDDASRLQPSHNATSPPRVTNEQRERMSEISRTAGSHMRPIGASMARQGRAHSPILRSVSNSSSRESSPSPPRPLSSPPGGVIGGKPRTVSDASHHTDSALSYMTRSTSSGTNDGQENDSPDGVVRKSIFGDSGNGLGATRRTSSGSRRASGGRRRKRQSS